MFATYLFDAMPEMLQRAFELFTWESITTFGVLVLSLVLTVIYAGRWQRNFDINFTLIFTIIPMSCIGSYAYSFSREANEAMLALKITYLGGCYLTYFSMLAICNLCNVIVPKVLKVILLIINSTVYLTIISTEITKFFYTSVSFEMVDGTAVLHREYGFMHTIFLILVLFYFFASFLVTFISLFFRKNLPRRRAVLIFSMLIVCVFSFFAGKEIPVNLDLTIMSYVFAQLIFLIIIRRIAIYNVRDSVVDSLLNVETDGYISFDNKLRYLGCIGIANKVFPVLKSSRIDKKIMKIPEFPPELSSMLYEFRNTGKADPKNISRGTGKERCIYQLSINVLYNGKKASGYQIHIVDDTFDQIQINMLDRLGDYQKSKIDEKTANLQRMHDNLIMSMAMMVESRDNSTGGHIRRTSDCVRMLLDEMRKDPGCDFVNKKGFYENMIKAAPMHDLGKIAVRDSILQKPGKFEDWEFEEMKKHAAEGARIVHEILKNTDDNAFHILAENVAHYHHERWDGSGYPEGKVGEDIPIEARIMAIADVYDALVSKRVYKERMSFEKADSIIMEGMGKHFDPSLEKYYIAARPHFEEYYEREDTGEEQETDIMPVAQPETSQVQ